MDENLVGYLLNALEPEEHLRVEQYLHANSDAQRRLEALRRLFAPLAVGRDIEPPSGLAERTIAVCLRETAAATLPISSALPRAPRLRFGQALGHSAAWFRRGDALVAAGIILVFLGIGIPLLLNVAQRSQQFACQNNLRVLHTALVSYSDQHGGEFPRVEADPPRNVAGIFMPLLRDAGTLAPNTSVACPGAGKAPSRCCTLEELVALHRDRPEEFSDAVRDLSCCYAYSLGYGTSDGKGGVVHHGLRRGEGNDQQPILADRPDCVGSRVQPGNSPNHGRHGQNVLHVGGHIEFCTTRSVGADGDDIYINRDNRAAAGRDPNDTVLGASWTCPYPRSND